MGCGVGPLAAS